MCRAGIRVAGECGCSRTPLRHPQGALPREHAGAASRSGLRHSWKRGGDGSKMGGRGPGPADRIPRRGQMDPCPAPGRTCLPVVPSLQMDLSVLGHSRSWTSVEAAETLRGDKLRPQTPMPAVSVSREQWIFIHSVLEAGNLKSRCRRSTLPPEAPQEVPSCWVQLLVAPGVLGSRPYHFCLWSPSWVRLSLHLAFSLRLHCPSL